MPKDNAKTVELLGSVSPVALVIVLGASTAMGKTTIADATTSFFQAANVAVHTVRIETGRRRAEFPVRDTFIDLDTIGDAAHAVGAEASLFDGVYRKIKAAIAGGHVVVIDCGAGGQRLLLEVAGSTGLSGLVAAGSASCWVVVVTTPDPESARQAAALVTDVNERMPEAEVLLAVNYATPTQRPGLDTPQARAFTAILESSRIPKIDIPFAGAQALAAFAKSQRTFLEILRADEQQLMRWSGRGELSSLSAQTHLAAWWRSFTDQLSRVWRFDASNR
jgi:hypothetical protein